MTAPNAELVNPLVGELTTISVVRRGDTREDVQAKLVTPGLAITPIAAEDALAGRPRYNLTHTATGLSFRYRVCGAHALEVAKLAAASVVDWTETDKAALVDAIKATDLLDTTRPISPCMDGYCTGDGPEPPSYGVRCHTCYWEWEDEYNEGPLSLKDARQQADDHECEPELQIKSPVTGKWHETYAVTEAEKKVANPDTPAATA